MDDIHPDGPRIVGARNQVTLPQDQLQSIGVEPGDGIWVALNPDKPGTLVVLTDALMGEVFRKGWTAV